MFCVCVPVMFVVGCCSLHNAQLLLFYAISQRVSRKTYDSSFGFLFGWKQAGEQSIKKMVVEVDRRGFMHKTNRNCSVYMKCLLY